jgi:hypothetical protein
MKTDSNIRESWSSILIFTFAFLPLVLWFVYQAHFYATHVRIGLPPDEPHHYHLALFYKETPGIFLTASEETYRYGPVEYHPYLYHLIVGKLLLLNFLEIPESLLLRYVSILCSVGTLFALWALLGELRVALTGKLVAIAAITNITMFVYISSAISYDSFINLLSVMLQLYYIKALREPTWRSALICVICFLAGSLAKLTFLPFLPIMAIISVFCYQAFFSAAKTIWSQRFEFKEALLGLIAAVLLVGNVHLYAGNYLKFGTITPTLDQIVGKEVAAATYLQAARDQVLAKTRATRPDMTLSEFLPKFFESALKSLYGIMGHGSFHREGGEMRGFYLTALPAAIGGAAFFILLLFGRESSPKEVKRAVLIATLFSALYIVFVALYNFKSFQALRLFGYALQGRYLFPVLCSFLSVCAFFGFYRVRDLRFSLPVAAIIVAVFFKQGLFSIVERLQKIGFFQ